MAAPPPPSTRRLGRYRMAGPIAVGGMASVHFGTLSGPGGFHRAVAIKRVLGSSSGDPRTRARVMDEARLASRVHHANVVQTLDVVEDGDELLLVLEYVHGESLDRLLELGRAQARPVPPRLAAAVLAGALRGLHAAHEATGEDGQPLELVHRDLSPHNILVDVNGIPRVLDFGVARARGRLQATQDGQLKGKLAYLAPEQVHGAASRRSDLFAAGVVLWECLAGRQLFRGDSEAALLSQVLLCRVPPLASVGVDAPGLQAVLDRALEREPEARFATAAEMADALEAAGVATTGDLAAWVRALAAEALRERTAALEALDRLPPDGEAGSAPAPAPLPAGAARRRWPLAAAVAAALVAAGVGLALRLAPGASAPRVPRTAEPTSAPAQAPTAPPPSQAEPATPAPAPAELPPPASPTPASPAALAIPDTGGAAPRPPSRAPARTPSRPAKAACNPPYVIDSNGVKRFKVECLE